MRIIVPQTGNLAFTVGTPTYVHAAWATGTAYDRGTTVRYSTDHGGTIGVKWYDYTARYTHTSSSANTPDTSYYLWGAPVASATVTGYTYTTNVALSLFPTWATGAAVTAGTTQMDDADHNDYYAPAAVSSSDNTIRPSLAVESATAAIAARWVRLGPSNAWAPYDLNTNNKLIGLNPSGGRRNPVTFSFTCIATDTVNALVLAGIFNARKIDATVTVNNGVNTPIQETFSKTFTVTGTTYGYTPRSIIFDLSTAVTTGSEITVALSITLSKPLPLEIGVAFMGTTYELADTEWGLETRLLSFSRKEREPTFGNTTFVKRGTATLLTASCYYEPSVIKGDTIFNMLALFDGQPIMMDFNNASTASDYDRLRVFGFYSEVKTGIPMLSYEMLNMSVESLVQ
jgi:hypothetical protein